MCPSRLPLFVVAPPFHRPGRRRAGGRRLSSGSVPESSSSASCPRSRSSSFLRSGVLGAAGPNRRPRTKRRPRGQRTEENDLLAVHRLAASTGFFDRPPGESFDSLHTTGPQPFMTSSGIRWELESAGDCFALGPLGSMLHAQTERDGPVRYGGCLVAAHRRGHVGE